MQLPMLNLGDIRRMTTGLPDSTVVVVVVVCDGIETFELQQRMRIYHTTENYIAAIEFDMGQVVIQELNLDNRETPKRL